jgi:UDP-glucose 4-epimerase
VLVTGGAGFVGSNLVRLLLSSWDSEVTVLDDLSTGSRVHLEGVDCELVEASVTDEAALRRALTGRDVVFHLAARNIVASMSDPVDDLNVNARGTFNVLSLARELAIPRIVYTSTSSVYGNSRALPVHEETPPAFLNFYSVSKFAGEAYAQTFANAYKLPVNVTRYSNVYGPRQSAENPYCGVVGKFVDSALRGADILIHGDGEQTRDFTYVEDACEATLQAANEPHVFGEVFNVATGIETSVNRLAELIIELTESTSRIRHTTNRDIDNIRRRALNIEKAGVRLGYQPKTSLRDGLAQTIEWYARSGRNARPDRPG